MRPQETPSNTRGHASRYLRAVFNVSGQILGFFDSYFLVSTLGFGIKTQIFLP